DIDAATARFGLTVRENLSLRLEAAIDVLGRSTEAMDGLKRGFLQIQEQAIDLASVTNEAITGVYQGLEDQFASLFDTGEFSLDNIVNNLQQQLGRFAFRNLSQIVFETTGLGDLADQIIGGAGGERTQTMNVTATGAVNIGGQSIGT